MPFNLKAPVSHIIKIVKITFKSLVRNMKSIIPLTISIPTRRLGK
ncbi:hypothetical protein J2Z47_004829 [Cohnella thailandensis]|nr:hypothetical protein [Cohnella thailandensis]